MGVCSAVLEKGLRGNWMLGKQGGANVAIVTRLNLLLAYRKMSSKELARRIGLSQNNLSRIKKGHVKAIRWSTLEAICRELDCQPGDLLEYVPDPVPNPTPDSAPGTVDGADGSQDAERATGLAQDPESTTELSQNSTRATELAHDPSRATGLAQDPSEATGRR